MTKNILPKSAQYLLLITLFFCVNSSQANIVSLQVSKNITSTAEYLTGDADKPLLIIIHGFLQTREFSTVKRLSEALHENGFPILAPTLSLGISNRVQSIPCESIQLHSLNDDTDEIDKWVNWATRQGHKKIILIGHSSGSVNISAYLARGNHPAVIKSILISLTFFASDQSMAFETKEQAEFATDMISRGDNGLHNFSLQFCKDYVTTAENFLSYYNWSREQVLTGITTDSTQKHIILGSADDRISEQWINKLKQTTDHVIIIRGANHFFDQAHEFDLLESVENILSEY